MNDILFVYLNECLLMVPPRKQHQNKYNTVAQPMIECHVFPSSGCPVQESSQECRNPFRGFQGCMRLLTLDNQPVDLIKVQQRLLGNYSHLQIDICGIIDRLVFKFNVWFVFFTAVTPAEAPQVSECDAMKIVKIVVGSTQFVIYLHFTPGLKLIL